VFPQNRPQAVAPAPATHAEPVVDPGTPGNTVAAVNPKAVGLATTVLTND
jgi:hypothetical protein